MQASYILLILAIVFLLGSLMRGLRTLKAAPGS
jgi:hypothetical protein